MPANLHIKVGLLKKSEVAEAGRIVRLAFGTFLGVPDPLDFMGDRDLTDAALALQSRQGTCRA